MVITPDTPGPVDISELMNPQSAAQRRISADLGGGGISSQVDAAGKLFTNSNGALGKEDFLNLLVTQLRHQDPLQPQENAEFVAQLAQFSSLEGTQNINKSMEDLSKKLEAMLGEQKASAATMSQASATSLIGKQVRVQTDTLVMGSNLKENLKINVAVESGARSVLSIVDAEGNIVNALQLGKAGESTVEWNGLGMDGKPVPAGKYSLKVTSDDGKIDTGYAYTDHRVSGIHFAKEGMRLEVNGQEVTMDRVVRVGEAPAATVPVLDGKGQEQLNNNSSGG